MDTKIMKEVKELCAGTKANPNEMMSIINICAIGSAAAAGGLGWIPIVGHIGSNSLTLFFVATMYVCLAREMGITFSRGLMRSIGSMIISKVMGKMTVSMILAIILSLFPGLGSVSSAVIVAVAQFCCTYLSAMVFVKMLSALVFSGVDLQTADENTLKNAAEKAHKQVKAEGMNGAMKEAVSAFGQASKNGELERAKDLVKRAKQRGMDDEELVDAVFSSM